MNALFFWIFSIGMIGSGLTVILNRNPVASAISFAFTIFFMAGLFILLNAFFLAAVQVLVTAGAVMVLFLFIIMLLDITAMEHVPRRKFWMGCSLAVGLGFIYLVALTLNQTPEGAVGIDEAPNPSTVAVSTEVTAGGQTVDHTVTQSEMDLTDDTHQIGKLLFTSYVAPFEVTSLLILVATIGVIVLCKQDDRTRSAPRDEIIREAPPVEPKKETAHTR